MILLWQSESESTEKYGFAGSKFRTVSILHKSFEQNTVLSLIRKIEPGGLWKGCCVALEKKFQCRILIFTILMRQSYKLGNIHIFHWINKPSQRKIRSPEHCSNLERWQGPPQISKENGMKLCCPQRSVCCSPLVALLIKMSSSKLHSAPLS